MPPPATWASTAKLRSDGPPRANRLLLIRPSALGDVCRTVPLLTTLRAGYPSARIDWLVREEFADAVRHHPALDGVVPFRRSPRGVAGLRTLIGALHAARYDLVIDAQGLARSGLLSLATRAPRRVGHADARELGWLGVNIRVPRGSSEHTVDRMLDLAAALGLRRVVDLRLYTAEADRDWAAAVLRPDEGPAVVLAPTSRWPGKRWPEDRFADLARRLVSWGVGRVVLVGGPGEADQCPRLTAAARDHPRIVNLIGLTTVGRLMALIQRSALVVANDSAALHMAVGFDRPLIALFGPTSVELVGPYGREADVIQRPRPGDRARHKDAASGAAMMARITVDEVASAAMVRLNAARTPET